MISALDEGSLGGLGYGRSNKPQGAALQPTKLAAKYRMSLLMPSSQCRTEIYLEFLPPLSTEPAPSLIQGWFHIGICLSNDVNWVQTRAELKLGCWVDIHFTNLIALIIYFPNTHTHWEIEPRALWKLSLNCFASSWVNGLLGSSFREMRDSFLSVFCFCFSFFLFNRKKKKPNLGWNLMSSPAPGRRMLFIWECFDYINNSKKALSTSSLLHLSTRKDPSFIPQSCSYRFPQFCLKYIILFSWKRL